MKVMTVDREDFYRYHMLTVTTFEVIFEKFNVDIICI